MLSSIFSSLSDTSFRLLVLRLAFQYTQSKSRSVVFPINPPHGYRYGAGVSPGQRMTKLLRLV